MLRDTTHHLQSYRLSPDHSQITWRILYSGTPRYITAATTAIPPRAQTHEPLLLTLLPSFPSGPWIHGLLEVTERGVGKRLRWARKGTEGDVRELRIANVEAEEGQEGKEGKKKKKVYRAEDLRTVDQTRENEGVKIVKRADGSVCRWRFAVWPEDIEIVKKEMAEIEAGNEDGMVVGLVKEGEAVTGFLVEERL